MAVMFYGLPLGRQQEVSSGLTCPTPQEVSRSGTTLSAKRMQVEPELASATTVLSKEHELFAISASDFGAFMVDGAGDDG